MPTSNTIERWAFAFQDFTVFKRSGAGVYRGDFSHSAGNVPSSACSRGRPRTALQGAELLIPRTSERCGASSSPLQREDSDDVRTRILNGKKISSPGYAPHEGERSSSYTITFLVFLQLRSVEYYEYSEYSVYSECYEQHEYCRDQMQHRGSRETQAHPLNEI